MNLSRKLLSLLAVLGCALSAPASATQIICLINNSSQAIRIVGAGEGAATIEYEAKGGDKNQCWHVAESANALRFVGYHTKDAAGYWQNAGIEKPIAFQNTPIVKSQWFFWEKYSGKWDADVKNCGKQICMYHSTHTDVWRLYVVDK